MELTTDNLLEGLEELEELEELGWGFKFKPKKFIKRATGRIRKPRKLVSRFTPKFIKRLTGRRSKRKPRRKNLFRSRRITIATRPTIKQIKCDTKRMENLYKNNMKVYKNNLSILQQNRKIYIENKKIVNEFKDLLKKANLL